MGIILWQIYINGWLLLFMKNHFFIIDNFGIEEDNLFLLRFTFVWGADNSLLTGFSGFLSFSSSFANSSEIFKMLLTVCYDMSLFSWSIEIFPMRIAFETYNCLLINFIILLSKYGYFDLLLMEEKKDDMCRLVVLINVVSSYHNFFSLLSSSLSMI